ncbi:DNA polymerase III subunit beta [bacterium]|nr:DNA polymerase III subunit beta [bacterium]
MKAQFRKDALAQALQKVRGAVDEQTPLPILTNVLLEAKDGKSHLTGTNLELRITVALAGSVADKGDIAVPAKTIGDMVSRLADPESSLMLTGDAQKGQVHVTAVGKQKFSANLPALSRDDFPKSAKLEGEVKLSVPAKALLSGIRRAAVAAAVEDSRRYLTGVLFDLEGSDLKLVATDSHRLAFVKIPVEGKFQKREFLVPIRAALEIIRCLPDTDSPVAVTFSERVALFSAEGITLQTQLIAEKFPNYSQVIPKEFEIDFKADVTQFTQALRLVSIFTDNQNPRVNIKLEGGGSAMKLSAVSQDRGSGDATVDVTYNGSPLELAFNAQYCMDALSQIETPEVQVRIITPKNPCVFRSPDDQSHLHVIMPMRI